MRFFILNILTNLVTLVVIFILNFYYGEVFKFFVFNQDVPFEMIGLLNVFSIFFYFFMKNKDIIRERFGKLIFYIINICALLFNVLFNSSVLMSFIKFSVYPSDFVINRKFLSLKRIYSESDYIDVLNNDLLYKSLLNKLNISVFDVYKEINPTSMQDWRARYPAYLDGLNLKYESAQELLLQAKLAEHELFLRTKLSEIEMSLQSPQSDYASSLSLFGIPYGKVVCGCFVLVILGLSVYWFFGKSGGTNGFSVNTNLKLDTEIRRVDAEIQRVNVTLDKLQNDLVQYDSNFKSIDHQLVVVSNNFSHTEESFDRIDKMLRGLDGSMVDLDRARITKLEDTVGELFELLNKLDEAMQKEKFGLSAVYVAMNKVLLCLMSLQVLLSKSQLPLDPQQMEVLNKRFFMLKELYEKYFKI